MSEEREIEVPDQGYNIYSVDEEGVETPAEGILFVLRIDDWHTPPLEAVAARHALLNYAGTIDDREFAELIVQMVCQVKKMDKEHTEELIAKINAAYNSRKVQIPMPRKRLIRERQVDGSKKKARRS